MPGTLFRTNDKYRKARILSSENFKYIPTNIFEYFETSLMYLTLLKQI